MKRVVWDVEANDLLDKVTEVHCLVAKDIDTGEITRLYGPTLTPDNIVNLFEGATSIIGHNIISYDLPLLRKMFDIDLIGLLGKESIEDTYLWSKVLFPDRQLPKGCPTSIKNPVTNRLKRIGPHGLESWGWRVGEKKVEIHDWRFFDDEMLKRCEVDVNINEKVYYMLLKEGGL